MKSKPTGTAASKISGRAGNFRCDVCGYSNAFGNEATGEPPGLREVRWSPRFNEHQCETCSGVITEIRTDYEIKEQQKEHEEHVETSESGTSLS
jgi:hypothetical protein